MFQFAAFALQPYVFRLQYPYGWVSPFGNLRINACLLAPRSLSQATTSFIAWHRQGIHHVHLFTCPYNVDFYFAVFLFMRDVKTGYRSITMRGVTFAVSKMLRLHYCLRKRFTYFLIWYNHNPSDCALRQWLHPILRSMLTLIYLRHLINLYFF